MNARRLLYERIGSEDVADVLAYIQNIEEEKMVLAMAANNVIMEGSYSGDAVITAAEFMSLCVEICGIYNKRKELD
jgi:hypothetical protein